MLTFHKLALTLLITAGPFRLACHSSVKPAGEDTAAATVSCAESAKEEAHARAGRFSWVHRGAHLKVRVVARSCQAASDPGSGSGS